MSPETLARTIGDFLATAEGAVVMENGALAFDLAQAKYSVSGETHKCLLHLWSPERNVVRRVLDAEVKHDVLRLAVQKMGQSRPTKLEICRERDRRTPNAKRAARMAYQCKLQRVLERRFTGFKIAKLSTAMDLEKSFGPIYTRGIMVRGQSAFAILGVNGEEAQASIDAALTFGILWLDLCRQSQTARAVEGLKLFLPPGTSALTRERMARLQPTAAKWQLYEFDARADELKDIDVSDCGNVATRLVRWYDEHQVLERFAEPIAYIRELISESVVAILSPAEIVFRCHGLEFAHARIAHLPGSLESSTEITFGLGAEERVLDENNADAFRKLARSIGEVRHPDGPRDHFLWRLHPERWLESLVVQNVAALDSGLDPDSVYSQLPAFSAGDRAMIDVLAMTWESRLAVIELKAEEDIHLPLQGLDYWSRVSWHHARGEFQQFGYFPGRQLSPQMPLLVMVAPALHVHPATDTLLRYFSPEIEWLLVGIDERWRNGVRTVFRKRSLRRGAQEAVANQNS
jgi:hypothetical protein